MAPKTATNATDNSDNVTLTAKEVKILVAIFQSAGPDIKVDTATLATECNYATRASANTAWHSLRTKLGIAIPASGANNKPNQRVSQSDLDDDEATADEDGPATPAASRKSVAKTPVSKGKTPRKRSGRKPAAAAADEDEDENGSGEDIVRTLTSTGKRKRGGGGAAAAGRPPFPALAPLAKGAGSGIPLWVPPSSSFSASAGGGGGSGVGAGVGAGVGVGKEKKGKEKKEKEKKEKEKKAEDRGGMSFSPARTSASEMAGTGFAEAMEVLAMAQPGGLHGVGGVPEEKMEE